VFADYARFFGNVLGTKLNHKYYVSMELRYNDTLPVNRILIGSGGYSFYREDTWTAEVGEWGRVSGTFTRDNTNGSDRIAIYPNAVGWTAGNSVSCRNVMCIDLTLLYGIGNEPTAQQFEAMFPASYYAYNAGELLSAGVTEVVSKDSNNATLQTIPIPTAIRNLEGYGWSAGNAYNYVDFERKVFVKNVGKIILNGTQTFRNVNWVPKENGVGWIYGGGLGFPKANGGIVCERYDTKAYGTLLGGGLGIALGDAILGICIRQSDTSLTTASAINAYLSANPLTVYFELATPIETDISAYLTDDNLIQVEAGGTLTFENQHGDDYQIPVPSEETYMIDLQASLGG
jgi:hypothetical protein